MNIEQLHQRYLSLLGLKGAKRENMYHSSQFFEPNDSVLAGESLICSTRNEYREFLDTTGVKVTEEYISSVLGLTYNADRRWFKIEHADIKVDSDEQKVLDERAEILFKQIARTNYYQQIPDFEFNTIGYGHGLMVIDKDKDNFANCYSRDPYDVCFSSDIYGNVFEVFWRNNYQLYDMLKQFPELESLKNAEAARKEALGIAATAPDLTFNISIAYVPLEDPYIESDKDKEMAAKGYKFVQKFFFQNSSGLFAEDTSTIIQDIEPVYFKGRTVFPCRDCPNTSLPYGKGIFRDLLPKARIANSLKYNILRMAQYMADPASVMDQSIFKESGGRVDPGRTFVRQPREASYDTGARQPSVELLQITGDIAAVDAIHQKEVEQMVDALPLSSNIYKTARQSIDEIQQRTMQQEKKLAPIRANFIREGLSAHLRRFYQICEEQGLFNDVKLPDESKADIKYSSNKLIFDGFLLQKHRETRAAAVIRALNSAAPLAPVSPQSLGMIDGDKTLKTIYSGFGVMDTLKSDRRVAEERQQTINRAERQQQREDQMLGAQNSKATAQIIKSLENIDPRGS